MTNDNQPHMTAESKQIPFGARLKSAREALGLERKDAANQLRLNEKVILMMEKDRYPTDLPVTFIRGYLRAYAKLLQIPEPEVRKAIEPIKPKPTSYHSLQPLEPVASTNYFMQLITYIIIFTVIGLAAMWWYSRNPSILNSFNLENSAPAAAAQEIPAVTATPSEAQPVIAEPTPSTTPAIVQPTEPALADSMAAQATAVEAPKTKSVEPSQPQATQVEDEDNDSNARADNNNRVNAHKAQNRNSYNVENEPPYMAYERSN